MTGFTPLPLFFVMYVVMFVAVDASRLQFIVDGGNVTSLAANATVFSGEGIIRVIMRERVFIPLFLTVTILAFLTKVAFVRVALFVAVETFSRCRRFVWVVLMTLITANHAMRVL